MGSEWGSYAAAPALGGGARRAVREAAEEASEQLARQGVRQAVRNADEWVNLYRAVSPEELEDILKMGGQLRRHPRGLSMEGKWFTTTPEYAARWAKKFLYRNKPYSIIEVKVSRSVLRRMQYRERLDVIGPAYYADPTLLLHIQFMREMPYIPWLP